jgi:hypothetical protein
MAAAEAKMSAWLGVAAAFGVVDFLGLGGFFELTAFFGLSALGVGNLIISGFLHVIQNRQKANGTLEKNRL